MSHGTKLVLWLTMLAVLCWCPYLLAQYGETQSDQSKMGNAPVTVTGCLKQGSEHTGYYVKTSDGKIYELSGKQDFGKHVGHTVTVAGQQVMLSKAEEAKMEQHEKTEAEGKPYADLKVTSMKHVSETCSQ
jgi:hypothetical protein